MAEILDKSNQANYTYEIGESSPPDNEYLLKTPNSDQEEEEEEGSPVLENEDLSAGMESVQKQIEKEIAKKLKYEDEIINEIRNGMEH